MISISSTDQILTQIMYFAFKISLLLVCIILTSQALSSTYASTDVTAENEGRTWNKLSNLYMYYHTVEKLQKYEDLMNQYRTFLINFIYENNDVCNLYEYMTDKANDIWAASNEAIENQAAGSMSLGYFLFFSISKLSFSYFYF